MLSEAYTLFSEAFSILQQVYNIPFTWVGFLKFLWVLIYFFNYTDFRLPAQCIGRLLTAVGRHQTPFIVQIFVSKCNVQLWGTYLWKKIISFEFQVSCHGFVPCWRHGWSHNATAQGTNNKWTLLGFGPPWHCSQACPSIFHFCFSHWGGVLRPSTEINFFSAFYIVWLWKLKHHS